MVASGLRNSWEASLTSRCWAARPRSSRASMAFIVAARWAISSRVAGTGTRCVELGARDRRHPGTDRFHRPQRRSHQPVGAHDH